MKSRALLVTAAVALATAIGAGEASAKTKWLCEPGVKPNPCKGSLETTVYSSNGESTVVRPPNARRPGYDCFYVYPTVSEQPTPNANKDIDPQQIAIANYQAARYSQECRVYAPVYRQATLAAIGDPDNVDTGVFEKAYGDVLAAWKSYLRKHNRGRGVVLIGHSQGTGMLSRLLGEEIEENPSQRRRLIMAILLGGNVTVEKGSAVGGSFDRTPLCRNANHLGCVIAFSAFDEPPPEDALFGRTDGPFAAVPDGADPRDYKVACVNPAAIAGGPSRAETIVRTEPFPGTLGIGIQILYGGPAPTAPTPYLTPQDHYDANCVQGGGARWLQITPRGAARDLNPSPLTSWGLHLIDANIALGDLVEVVRKKGNRYVKRNR